MSANITCLDISSLERIKTGQISNAEIDQVAGHLEECPACADRVHAGDFIILAAEARSGAKHLETDLQPVVVNLMRKLHDLSGADTSLNGGNTPFPPANSPDSCLSTLLAPAQRPDEMGRLGIYRVLGILGKGGMGLVLEAEDTLLKRPVALKVILPQLLQRDEARQRFQREARAAAALQSDFIVPIHQIGEERGVPFLAMPLLRGETLDSRLRRDGRLPLMEVLRLGREIALGLSVAHEHGLIHRDIKPSNIWLETKDEGGRMKDEIASSSSFRVKILDFGLARETNNGDTRLTGSGAFLGTPAYMAPEQVDNQPLDGRCDLFSLGCVLYQMGTGKMPFQGDTPLGLMRSLSIDTPKSPRDLNPELPTELSELIQCLLAKDPGKRPASAARVAQQLADLERRLSAPPETKPPASNGMGHWVALAACLLLLLGGSVYYLGGTVYRFATNKGDLVIQVDDPTVEIKIVQNGIVVHDKPSKREFILTAGTGEIEVLEKDGIKLTTRQFELTRNGKTTVKVTLQELADARKAKPKPDEKPFDPKVKPDPGEKPFVPTSNVPDRRAAEWVRSIGGMVATQPAAGDAAVLFPGPFELISVHLAGNKKVNTAGLANFKDCKNVQLVYLIGTDVDDSGLFYFKDCKNLQRVDLNTTKVSDVGLAYLKDCKNLITLNVRYTKLTDAGLDHFKDCKKLKELHLGGTQVTAKGLAHFKALEHLEVLTLDDTQTDDLCLAQLKDWKSLANLSLHKTKLTDVGLAHLKDYQNLTNLTLSRTEVSNAGLVHFKDCKKLKYLSLEETKVSDEGLAHLKECKNLTFLDLQRTEFTAAGIAELKKALPKCRVLGDGKKTEGKNPPIGTKPSLVSDSRAADRRAAEWVLSIGGTVNFKEDGFDRELQISKIDDLPWRPFTVTGVFADRVTDAGLANFKGCKNLTSLNLDYGDVTDSGLANFKDCKSLNQLQLHHFGNVSDAGLAHFKDCKKLIRLSLYDTKVSDAALAHFKNCADLEFLRLDSTRVSNEALAHFKNCKNLKSLDLSNTSVGDAGLAHFKDLKNLERVGLLYTPVTDAGLVYLKDFKNLESITLSNVGDVGLVHFKDCKNLREIVLDASPRVTNAGLGHFKECKNLQFLSLGDTRVSDGLVALLQGCKALRFIGLSKAPVGDATLESLAAFPNLTNVSVPYTKVSAAGVAALQKALPKCEIDWDGKKNK